MLRVVIVLCEGSQTQKDVIQGICVLVQLLWILRKLKT